MKNNEPKEVFFYGKLYAIKALYEKIKSAVILSENFDPEREYYVAVANELRSALDHIFKAMVNDEDKITYELKEVEEHLVRSGYDVYELLASNLCLSIIQNMNKYSPHVISHIFPDYFKNIKPVLSKIKVEIGELRTQKNKDIDLSFDTYMHNINQLIEFEQQITEIIPAMEDYLNYEKKKNRNQLIITIIISIVSLIIGSIIGWLIR